MADRPPRQLFIDVIPGERVVMTNVDNGQVVEFCVETVRTRGRGYVLRLGYDDPARNYIIEREGHRSSLRTADHSEPNRGISIEGDWYENTTGQTTRANIITKGSPDGAA